MTRGGKIMALMLGVGLVAGIFLLSRDRSKPPFPTVEARLGAIRTTPQISASWQTVFLIAPDGTLWWWGQDGTGGGGGILYPTPIQLGVDNDWVAVSASMKFGVALKADGSLWQFGHWSSGPQSSITNAPRAVMPDARWRAVSAGFSHVLAIRDDGTLWVWGRTLGPATTYPQPDPVPLSSDSDWLAVEADNWSSFAIKTDGTLWQWVAIGLTKGGITAVTVTPITQLTPAPLGKDSDWQHLQPTGVGNGVIGRKQDGSLWRIGINWPQVNSIPGAASLTNEAVALPVTGEWLGLHEGHAESFGLKPDGTLWTWETQENRSDRKPKLRQFGQRSDWLAYGSAYGRTHIAYNAAGEVWTWGVILGMPERRTPWSALNQAVMNRFNFSLGGPSYPQTDRPWVILRFVTNAPPAHSPK